MIRYIIRETKNLDVFDTLQDAKKDLESLSIFFPENGYEIIEQELEE